jgi:tetratricopeptide (TPR) repeat protein/TolB-like protein
MPRTPRPSRAAAVLILSAAPLTLTAQSRIAPPAQRGGQPLAETPYILVTAFHAPTKELAVEAADELRSRLQSEHSSRELFVITKSSVEATLKSSGYPVDSALGVADLMELARALHAEYVVDGSIANAAAGHSVQSASRVLIRTGTQTLAQPLPTVDGKDAGDAAKFTERGITEALKQMPGYRDCIAALRSGRVDDALTKARTGITAYMNAAFARVCLLNGYVTSKTTSPDSIIALGNQILAVDSTSMLALVNIADAYDAKGEKDKATEIYARIHELDQSNTAVSRILRDRWGGGDGAQPAKALALVDEVLKDNPADVEMVRTKRLLQLKLGQFKQAIATGDELIKLDTASATIDFFNRQIGAAQSDSNTAKVVELAQAASKRFPGNSSFALLVVQGYYKAGQLPQALVAARAAAAASPKSLDAWRFVIVILSDQNQPDSALAAGQQAIAAGAAKDSIGDVLLARVAGPSLKAAQNTKARSDWQTALKASQAVDAITSSAQTSFYVGVSSFTIASDILSNDVQPLTKSKKHEDQVQACTLAKQAEDLLATTSMSMPRGGSVDKNVAGQILGAVGQYGEFVAAVKKSFCK